MSDPTETSRTDTSAARARTDLGALEAVEHRTQDALTRSARHNAAYAVALGLLFGGLSLAVGLTEHTSPAGLISAIAVFAVLMQVIVAWRDRSKRATGSGWGRRLGWALAATVALYGAGVFLAAFALVAPRPAIWVPYAVLTAAPLLSVAALTSARR